MLIIKVVFFNEKKNIKIRMIFYIEKWLCKSEFCYIWPSIPKQTKYLELLMAVFIDLWPCLITTKLSFAQLFKWGHSKHTNGHQITTEWGMYYQNLLVFARWNLFQWLQVKHHYVQRKICDVHQVLGNPEEFFHIQQKVELPRSFQRWKLK